MYSWFAHAERLLVLYPSVSNHPVLALGEFALLNLRV